LVIEVAISYSWEWRQSQQRLCLAFSDSSHYIL